MKAEIPNLNTQIFSNTKASAHFDGDGGIFGVYFSFHTRILLGEMPHKKMSHDQPNTRVKEVFLYSLQWRWWYLWGLFSTSDEDIIRGNVT